MSDTPRTDAAAEWARPVDQSDTAPPNELYVDVEFARGLERENAKLHKTLCQEQELPTHLLDVHAVAEERDLLRVENAELRKDNARLREAAELGLEYVQGELAQRMRSFRGYPEKWKAEATDVEHIEHLLRGTSPPARC
jgi:hypothetical protein